MLERASSNARLRVTRWWSGEYGLAGRAVRTMLGPAEAAYRAATATRNRAYDAGVLRRIRLPVPVVSVGNLTIGGAGKTPVAAWLAAELERRGLEPALLHGGYGADEPALHRLWNPAVPVFTGRDRVEHGRRALAYGAKSIVLDDGFQHRRLERDVDLVLVAAETWTGWPALLPRGPWREGPHALARATLVGVTRKVATAAQAADVVEAVRARAGAVPVAVFALDAREWRRAECSVDAPDGDVLAVTGIAQPELFAASARAAGAAVAALIAFPDHHWYGAADARTIRRAAGQRPIVTTEKDWVKLRELLDEDQVWCLVQRVDVEMGIEAVCAALDGLGR